MKFSRAQQGKINLAQARADDMGAQSTSLFNVGVQESTDDAIYKIFGNNLKLLSDQANREYESRTKKSDLITKAVGLGGKALNLIPGIGPGVAAALETVAEEGTRYLTGGYDGVKDSQVRNLGMQDTLFKRKTVRNSLLDSQDDILQGYDDVEDARKVNLAINAAIGFGTSALQNAQFDATKPEGSPYTYGEMVDEGNMTFGEGLKASYVGGVPSESFYKKSLDAYVTKESPDANQLSSYLRKVYNIYPDVVTPGKDKGGYGYNYENDMRALYGLDLKDID